MWGSLLDCINVMISEVALFLSQLESHCFVVVHLMFALYATQSTGERGRREVAWSHEKGVFIYRIFYVHIQMLFTLLQCKVEIGQQHISISDLIQPTQPMNHEIAQRPDQHTGLPALLIAISVWVL